jgi:ribonuclease HI
MKSVIQAIPTYPMSVFKFSEGLCEDLMKLTRDFWWGDEKERRRMHWMSWDKITKRKGQGGMGFKDLHLFNQALLAKQAWRLIAFPDSLCAKLLKAKYYPNGELMDTAFIQNPSPGWQGIMHGLELLKKGAIWRIGNGAKVRIWRDNWVPRGNMKISANVNNSRLRRVSQLINNHDHTWKEDVIRDIFMPHDADAVLRIRLPSYDDEDFISWTLENHGMFTVRSAYNLALDLKNGTPPNSSSCQNGDRNLWKVIWSTNVPPKVKIFTWKLATNNIAVQVNRARRLPNILPMCTICGMEEETGYHATMVCTKAIALRQGLEKSWNLPPESKLIHTGPDWVLVLLDSLTHDQRSKMMFLWWRAWHHRNNIIFDNGQASVDNSIRFLQNYLTTFQGIAAGHIVADRKGKGTISQGNVHRQGPILKENNENNTWMKPEEGWIKCNVDASFLSEGKTGSWGAVVRDNFGKIICSAWGLIPHCQSAYVAEAIACLNGLQVALNNSEADMIIESDSSLTIEAFREGSMDRSEISIIAKEFRRKKPPDRQVKILKINRNCNKVAHELCQFSRRELSSGVLLSAVPTCVSRAACNDCNPDIMF